MRAAGRALLDDLHRVPGLDDLDVDEVEDVLGAHEDHDEVAAVVADRRPTSRWKLSRQPSRRCCRRRVR